VRSRQKASTGNTKVGVGQSNGDVISVLVQYQAFFNHCKETENNTAYFIMACQSISVKGIRECIIERSYARAENIQLSGSSEPLGHVTIRKQQKSCLCSI
jgi:hypothetical protein